MDRIAHIVRDHLNLPEEVRADVLAVYDSIARAESHAHGVGVADIHFHEAGTMDALADITAAALLKHFVTRFGEMPVMTTEAIGYGMGTKEFDAANCPGPSGGSPPVNDRKPTRGPPFSFSETEALFIR